MRLLFAWCLGLFMLISCKAQNSAQGGAKYGANKPGNSNAVFDGTWKSQCKSDTSSDGSATSQQTIYTNKGELQTGFVYEYNDATCSQLMMTVKTLCKVEKGEPFTPIQGAVKVTSTLTDIQVSFSSGDYVKLANERQYYGYNNWVANVPKNVSGKKFTADSADADTVTVGRKYYDIAKVIGQRLHAGDDATGDAQSEATRPTALDMKEFDTKQ